MSNNSISDTGAVVLTQALHRNSTLEVLYLSINSISDAGAVALAQVLHYNSTLNWLDLGGNDSIDEEGMHQLVQTLTIDKERGLVLPKRCEEYATQCKELRNVRAIFFSIQTTEVRVVMKKAYNIIVHIYAVTTTSRMVYITVINQ